NIVSTPVNAANAFRGVNAASTSGTFSAVGPSFVPFGRSFPIDVNDLPDDSLMPDLEDTAEIQSTGFLAMPMMMICTLTTILMLIKL
ncbi:hypothetical protein Tco_0512883, partial [Tanacetum coccineum]